ARARDSAVDRAHGGRVGVAPSDPVPGGARELRRARDGARDVPRNRDRVLVVVDRPCGAETPRRRPRGRLRDRGRRAGDDPRLAHALLGSCLVPGVRERRASVRTHPPAGPAARRTRDVDPAGTRLPRCRRTPVPLLPPRRGARHASERAATRRRGTLRRRARPRGERMRRRDRRTALILAAGIVAATLTPAAWHRTATTSAAVPGR